MEYKEYRAKTVNDAITDALIDLEITSDLIEYEVIEEGSSGLLGLFSKDAVIRARRKEEPEEEKAVDFSDIKIDIKSQERAEEKPVKKQAAKKAAEKKAAEKKETEEKPEAPEPEKTEAGAAPSVTETYENESINELLKKIFEKLGIEAKTKATIDRTEKVIEFLVEGDNTGDIIGKRGQTLDAIQYLVSIIINKGQNEYYRVKLDTNNYRERRKKTLENLAKNVASKVKKTRKKVALEPMNPYERRVIHSFLQADKNVTTKSEGEEPNRRVVVYYKKS